MRSVTVNILVAFVAHASATEQATNRMGDKQHDSLDKLADHLVDKLFERVLKASQPQQSEVEATMLAKPGAVAMPSRTSLLLRTPTGSYRATQRAAGAPQPALTQGSAGKRGAGLCFAKPAFEQDPGMKQQMEATEHAMAEHEVQRQLKMAATIVQSADMQDEMKALRNDPELKPMFDEMSTGGQNVIMKYYSDAEFLKKVGERLGNVPGHRMQEAQQAMGEAFAKIKELIPGQGETRTVLAMRRSAARAGELEAPNFLDENGDDLGKVALRLIGSTMMVHNGLDKLADPSGFAKFVVEPYLHLPEALCVPATYAAAGIELVAPVLILLGIATRLASLGLLGTMGAAIIFHLGKTGLEGFPFGVVEAHQYGFETATVYAALYAYLALAGPGKYSIEGSGKGE